MAASSEILILVANEESATICSNSNGETRLLRFIDRGAANDVNGDIADDSRRKFASELMMTLCRDTAEHYYEGVVIFAEEPMMEALRRFQPRAISRLMIAQVVGKPSESHSIPGRSAANAQLAYRGAVH